MLRRTRVIGTSTLLALGLTVSGGYLVNAATAPTTVITACSNIRTGAVRVVAPAKACASTEKRLTWNVQGPAGARGLSGATGATGAPGTDGANGTDGLDGKDGAAGPAGADGKDGAPGAEGPQGPVGPAGPAGGGDVVNDNPNDLTYRMKLDSKVPFEITGFTQKFTDDGLVLGGSMTAKASIGELVATLPMSADIVPRMTPLAQGTILPTVRFELCKPGELAAATGPVGGVDLHPGDHCTLQVDMTQVLITGLDVHQDSATATATLTLIPATETLTYAPGTPDATSATLDVVQSHTSRSGTTLAAATGDTAYTATVTGAAPLGVISTDSWSESLSNPGTTQLLGGARAGKVNFSDVTAQTRTGPGTIALFGALTRGENLTKVELAGCETALCTQTAVLTDTHVTALVIGAPTLFDQTKLSSGTTIRWDRNDGTPGGVTKSFAWDVLNNFGL